MPSNPIRLGGLFSETGVTCLVEQSMKQGALLAVDDINESGGIEGRKLELILEDPKCRPASFAQLAEKLIRSDKVDFILGCYMSSTRKAVLPVVERYNALLFYPTLYEGFEYSRNIIYTGAAPNQNSLPLADFMLKNYGSRVCMIGSDYVYPYESNRIMSDLILERGGEKAYEHYLPLDAPAAWYGMTMEKVKDLAPDFIFSTVVGAATQHLYRAFAECGLDPQKTPIASLTTSETEIRQMGAECAAGHITAATYFQSIESDANQRCMTKHRRMFGDNQVTNMCWEAAYFQVHLLAMALRQTASMKVDEVLQVLPGLEFAAPQGIVRIDAQNHHTHLNPRIGRVNGEGQFEILAAESRSVRPDPYVVSHTLDDWALRMKDGK